MRYKPDQFLNEYERYIQTSNSSKQGSVELVMKRYQPTREKRLNPSCDQTGNVHPNQQQAPSASADPEKSKPNKKQMVKKPANKAKTAEEEQMDPALLIRARFGDKKASTVIQASDLTAFNQRFRAIFRLYNSKFLVSEGATSNNMKSRKAASTKGKKEEKKK